jgi:hypothetical protein
MGAPQYQQPQLDPVFGQLLMQSQQQGIAAAQQDVASQASRLAARFGTADYSTSPAANAGAPTPFGAGMITSADPGALLAWHGMQLAAAGKGIVPGAGRT